MSYEIMIKKETWFTQKFMLKALEAAGLPCTYMSLLNYERKGIVLKPKKMIEVNEKLWRFYTKDEIKENVARVKKYKKEKQN